MADRDVKCKECGKIWTFTTKNTTFNSFRGLAKDTMISYARYYFCPDTNVYQCGNIEDKIIVVFIKNKKMSKNSLKSGNCPRQQLPQIN